MARGWKGRQASDFAGVSKSDEMVWFLLYLCSVAIVQRGKHFRQQEKQDAAAITQMRGVEELATDDNNEYGVQQKDSGQTLEVRDDWIC